MIGRTISHYRILEQIGEGGMGVVYRAEDLKLRRTVALKFLHPRAVGSGERKSRFLREAQAAAALDHPNICTIYEIDEDAGHAFISMAFVEGRNLKDRIRERPFELGEALKVADQVARGLEAAHSRGVVHRDIKSPNIMVTDAGHAKVMDFGLAKRVEEAELDTTTVAIGTPAYMSPEQLRGDAVDHRTDIWSWGVVLYEMLSGRLPFKADHVAALIHSILADDPRPLAEAGLSVPSTVEAIVRKALAKLPEHRFQSSTEVLHAIRSRSPGRLTATTGARPPRQALQASIAVLPFADLSRTRDQEYFCDGLADEIINDLAQLDRLRVASRTSSFAYKGRHEDIRQIGRALGVGTLLEGSVRKAGDRLRITAQLVDVANGYHLWSEQFDRDLQDVFEIQEEIARNIVHALRVELSDTERRALEKVATRDVEAYDYYLRGRQFFYRSRRKGIEFAIEMFERATNRDPGFAPAYAGIADCYCYLYMYFDHDSGNLQKAHVASRKALELDPDLAEAHASRGFAVSLSGDHDEAEREFEEAIRLNPHLFEGYYFYARTCYTRGDLEKAAHMYAEASRVSPHDYQAPALLGFTLRGLGREDEATAAYRQCLTNVRRHVELNPDDPRAIYLGAMALFETGDQDEGLRWAERSLAMDPDDPYIVYGIACFHSRAGNVEKGLHYLSKAVDTGFAHREWIEKDTDLDTMRDDPRYLSLLEGLDAD